ncbi:MAG: sigma-54-dependent Fis family transcriptional regulator [Desulfatibacillum sp.]|nr:sigma-54-dependent Fis family transcriptional regulator [Desulfatibacillum sp.]
MEKILIVDDDEGLNHFLGRFFKRKGYEVAVSKCGLSAMEKIAEENFDLVLMDYKMPGLNGLDTLHKIKESSVNTPIILMTAYGNTETAIEAMKRGAYDYLSKPFDRKELSRVVGEALALSRQMKEFVSFAIPPESHKETGAMRSRAIIGHSKPMQAVYKIIGQIAEKDVSVLIGGESGTGKELVARAIYHHSKRKGKPFLAINCAAIPENLFESELFGYERGAFTGADRAKIGKIERCHGGICFLDEIGEMSVALQAKLLRVLQEGEMERLGGRETIPVDVRIIAATNKNLDHEVQSGKFREDLYWRLKVISIFIPPLRARTEDIPPLVDYFLARFGAEYDKPIRHVSEGVLEKFLAYSWPGNVRELENCVRRAILLCAGDIISEDHIELLEPSQEHQLQGLNRDKLLDSLKDKLQQILPEILRLSTQDIHANILELVEEMIIMEALAACGQNQVQASKLLGISRNTLRHRQKKYLEKNEEAELYS